MAWLAVALAGAVLALPSGARAIVTPAVTVAGPASDIVDFGGIAMAPDGSGGLVFTKEVEGAPHVFASRYAGGRWSAPMRVDWDQPYEASQPRIAAGRGGELLVVWVTQVATVKNQVRYGLFSASIGRGASAFGPSQVVDPNVGEGVGVDPSLSATAPSQAIVAYRVITFNFNGGVPSTAVQLRPGDVMADVRLARLKEDRWSRIGAINRNPEASMRPPSPTNGPEVGAGSDGNAVVAWQEPDQTGAARIWVRRVFGTTPGPILEASPTSWEGTPVSGDVDAFSLAVTPLDQARIAMRLAPNAGQGRARLLLNTLPPGFAVPSNALNGPVAVFAADPTAGFGPPAVAATEKGGREGAMRLAFLAGAQARQTVVDATGALTPPSSAAGPAAVRGGETAVAVNSDGSAGILAYTARDAAGRQGLAVRQEFSSGAVQTALLSGVQGGPVAELRLGSAGSGDALVGFRQGEAGHFQIVADRVSAPPAAFKLKTPKGWVRPARARLRWQSAQSAVGGVTYSVLIGGRVVRRGLSRRVFHPRPALLGNGAKRVRVLATDGLGQQLLSAPAALRVDGLSPLARVRVRGGRRVTVRVADADSGLRPKATAVEFGDGDTERGGAAFDHVYPRAGLFRISVRARDAAGNRTARRFEVRVR